MRGIWVMLFFMGFRFCVAKVVQKKGKNKGKNEKMHFLQLALFALFLWFVGDNVLRGNIRRIIKLYFIYYKLYL